MSTPPNKLWVLFRTDNQDVIGIWTLKPADASVVIAMLHARVKEGILREGSLGWYDDGLAVLDWEERKVSTSFAVEYK